MTPTVKCELDLGSTHGWPDEVILIGYGDGRYVCVKASTDGVGGDKEMVFDGLVVHTDEVSAQTYLDCRGELPPGGVLSTVPYQTAREVAVRKGLDALCLYDRLRIVDVEYLR